MIRTVTPGLPVNFLEGSTDDLYGERLEELVADVERGIEDQVPEIIHTDGLLYTQEVYFHTVSIL